MRIVGYVLSAVLALVLLVLCAGGGMMVGARGMFGRSGMMQFGYGMPIWGMVMGIVWLLIIAAVMVGAILLVLALVRGAGHAAPASTAVVSARETPLDILRARYARGEITKEQFDQMRQDVEA